MSNISKIKVGETTYDLKDLNAMTYADNGVLGAKNLLPNNATSQTINGVTFTVNADGSVTANGTATANAGLTLFYGLLKENSYILNGCPSNGSSSTFEIYVNDNESHIYRDYGDSIKFDYNSDNNATIQIMVRNGHTANNLTFYPMLRLASDPDDTYVPYAMTNREITEELTVQTGSAITSDFTVSFSQLNKYGKIVELTAKISGVTGTGFDTIIANIPTGYRCSGNDRRVMCLYSRNGIFSLGLLIKTNGDIQLMQTISGAEVLIHAIWLID